MTRTIKILLSIIVLSSIYGAYIIGNPAQFSLATFHIPMLFCDFLAIYLINKQKVGQVTIILNVLLGLSIVNTCVSGFAWFGRSNDIKAVCDTLRLVVCIAELLVLAGGGYYHRIFKGFNTSSGRRHWARNPGLLIVDRNDMDGKCN